MKKLFIILSFISVSVVSCTEDVVAPANDPNHPCPEHCGFGSDPLPKP